MASKLCPRHGPVKPLPHAHTCCTSPPAHTHAPHHPTGGGDQRFDEGADQVRRLLGRDRDELKLFGDIGGALKAEFDEGAEGTEVAQEQEEEAAPAQAFPSGEVPIWWRPCARNCLAPTRTETTLSRRCRCPSVQSMSVGCSGSRALHGNGLLLVCRTCHRRLPGFASPP